MYKFRRLTNYLKFIAAKPKGIKILLACMPKSGSTFTARVLGNLDGVQIIDLVNGYERREQEIDLHRCIEHYSDTFVAQHHVRYSEPTKLLLQRFNMSSIFLTRNIFDVAISVRDHIRNESHLISAAYLERPMAEWSDRKLENAVADLVMPWYFNFYVSWYREDRKLHVTYEEMVDNKLLYFKKITDYAGFRFDDQQIEIAIRNAEWQNTRKNVGIKGRGSKMDSQAIEKIMRLSSYYDDVDFKLIGIS